MLGYILIIVKIFQFSHSACRIIRQHALCGKENLLVSEYKKNETKQNICLPVADEYGTLYKDEQAFEVRRLCRIF